MDSKSEKTYWEHFPHQADIGVRGVSPDISCAFEQAAIALTAVITEPEKIKPEHKVTITCHSNDIEALFMDWLNSLIYEMATRKMLFGRFEVCIIENRLNANIWGQKVSFEEHQPTVEIKGATYTALSVHQNENGNWVAQCVVDV